MEFKPKVEAWYYIIIAVVAVLPSLFVLYFMLTSSIISLPVIISTVFTLAFWAVDVIYLFPLTRARFVFKGKGLKVKCWKFIDIYIPYDCIESVSYKHDYFFLTSTALDGVEIKYYNNANKLDRLELSPDDRERFVMVINTYIEEIKNR